VSFIDAFVLRVPVNAILPCSRMFVNVKSHRFTTVRWSYVLEHLIPIQTYHGGRPFDVV
jgi:hypothetical protein